MATPNNWIGVGTVAGIGDCRNPAMPESVVTIGEVVSNVGVRKVML